jgi:hypothetical protein
MRRLLAEMLVEKLGNLAERDGGLGQTIIEQVLCVRLAFVDASAMYVNQQPVAVFGEISSGVTMKTFTPSIVEGSIFTCSRSAMAGIVGTISASLLSAALRHSSPVFHRSCHTGLSGAAINFCMRD